MTSDTLRHLAADLKKQAAEEQKAREVKIGHVLLAVEALALLKNKVNHG